MADTSAGGVSGSDSSRSAQDAASQAAETAAAQQAAADKAAADAAAAAAVDPVQAAPVDLSISPAAISQLSAMPVDTVPSLSSFQTLGGLPAANYADVAQALSATPTAPAITEFNAWSPSFSITPNTPAEVANAALGDVSVNLGLNYVGDVNASIEARMGIAPAQVTVTGSLSYTDGLNNYGLNVSAGPFGGVADPNVGVTANASYGLDFGKLDASLNANFNPSGFTNGSVNMGLSAPLSENWSGYARGTVGFDQNGMNSFTGALGANYNANGTSLSVDGSTRVDTRTGEISGRAGFNLGIKF